MRTAAQGRTMGRRVLSAWLVALAAFHAAVAAGPHEAPAFDGTVKAAAGADRRLFETAVRQIAERRSGWLRKAEASRPALRSRTVAPRRLVKGVADGKAFLGWRCEDAGEASSAYGRALAAGDTFVFDFGEHLVGFLSFALGREGRPVDAPPRLRFEFGELPGEALAPCEGPCALSLSWHQDETVTVDEVPGRVTLPRRFAFRYVKMTVLACSRGSRFTLADVSCRAVTSADETRLEPYAGAAEDRALDAIANRTLRDCMQTVLEDGPKRDRRLWLGDLRLQALANYRSYRNDAVVRRSLYLLAATCTANGLVATDAYERPQPENAGDYIYDYTALFANTVLEYVEATGDAATGEDLWPIVVRAMDYVLGEIDGTGLIVEKPQWWTFIDWQPAMDKRAAEQAVVVSALRAFARLGRRLGHDRDVAWAGRAIELMTVAAHRQFWDAAKGVWTSNGNVSWATQAWMALAGVSTADEAKGSLRTAMDDPKAVRPVTPYMNHYFCEALAVSGLKAEALGYLRAYWGGMAKLGADTYWEVWDPSDWEKSPYGNCRINSFCHAWSCTVGYLLRTHFNETRKEVR